MNKLIQEQLYKCKVANIPEFNENDTTITINKGSKVVVTEYQLHKCYLIEIADFILHPDSESVLADNWNGGTVPTYKRYFAEVAQLMGKMVKICGCGVDPQTGLSTNDIWEGWIPQSGIKLIKELE